MLQFHNSEISLSGRKMMCQSININEESSLTPIYTMGYRGANYQSPSEANKTSVSINYYCEVTGDVPNILLNQIKNYNFNSFPTVLAVAGKTGSAYLTKYSLSCSPNQAVIASADFDIFHELTGSFTRQNSNLVNQYNNSNASGIAHAWSTFPKTHNNLSTGTLISFDYVSSMEWRPIYKIGRNTPVETKFIKGTENFVLNHETTGTRVVYSGRFIEENIPSFHHLELFPLSFVMGANTTNKITLYLASGKLINNRINIQEDSLIANETSVVKYF